MKRRLSAITLLAILAIGILHAQNLDKILKNHFKNIGQKTVLKTNSLVSTGTMEQLGMVFPFKFIAKRPNKSYIEADIEGVLMKQGYNGESGWMIAPMMGSTDPIDISGPELRGLKQMADMDGRLWNYKEKGHQLELIGTEEMDGKKVYVLKLTDKEGYSDQMYMDTENYQILKVKSKMSMQGTEMDVESRMSDFRDVNGHIVAFTNEQFIGDQPSLVLKINEISQNMDIDDEIFEKPTIE